MKRFLLTTVLTFAVSTLALSLLNCTATTGDNSNAPSSAANTGATAPNSNAAANSNSIANTAADEKALRDIGREWIDAINRNDKAWLENMLTADYTWTSPEGTVNDKATDIAEAADTKFESFETSDEKIRIYGDAAIITGLAKIKGKYKNQDISGEYRFTDTFIRRNGSWRCAASQSTRVAKS